MKILILCTGNSCRSQMAHGILQSLDKNISVYSGGTEPAAQVNAKAVEVMKEIGIDISSHVPTHVNTYLHEEWDYVITVCGGANESCPAFIGKVGKRLHIGFDDPSHATGTPEFIDSEFRRVRDEIRNAFTRFYITEIRSFGENFWTHHSEIQNILQCNWIFTAVKIKMADYAPHDTYVRIASHVLLCRSTRTLPQIDTIVRVRAHVLLCTKPEKQMGSQ